MVGALSWCLVINFDFYHSEDSPQGYGGVIGSLPVALGSST